MERILSISLLYKHWYVCVYVCAYVCMRVHPSKVGINSHLCKVKPEKQFKKLYCYPVSQARNADLFSMGIALVMKYTLNSCWRRYVKVRLH